MLTGVVLARNEERNIVACLQCLRPHVSELLLIDMESQDRTVEFAQPLVDRVLHHSLTANFDAARNLAIPEASNDWLWFVDADEQIPAVTGDLVNRLVRERGSEFEAINIPFKSFFCGQWMQHGGWWPGYTCPRVLKRGYFEFSSRLHGGVTLNGREVRLRPDPHTAVAHYSFRDLSHYFDKFNRYTSTEALQLAERGIVYHWRTALRSMVHDLWQYYELNNGKLDGERGWILSWLAGQYRWAAVTKLLDISNLSDPASNRDSVPKDLDEFIEAFEEELAAIHSRFPDPPFDIIWRSPVWDNSVAAIESRECIVKLAGGNRSIVLETSETENSPQTPSATRTLLRAFSRCRRPRHVITITQVEKAVAPPDLCACYNVARLSSDSSAGIESIEALDEYNEVWVKSTANLIHLRQFGAAPERLRLFPELTPDPNVQDECLDSESDRLEVELSRIDSLFSTSRLPLPDANQVPIVLEGEFFAGHSFSNINEELAHRFSQERSLALSLSNKCRQQIDRHEFPNAHRIADYFDRALGRKPAVTIRHSYPPNWQTPESDRWVHIQPWEFGSLPKDWLHHLRDEVDEIWVMSRYVESVYLRSGIPQSKLHYIPWGIDPSIFTPGAPARRLPTDKSFRLLYVGGTIWRKGFDRVLQAYLSEFTSDDDICLVIKDQGAHSFYAFESMRQRILEAIEKPGSPSIIYLDQKMTAGQLASLYTACHCLVAPYRAEGFGLPILEALACGIPPIIPTGGPTDDFVDPQSGFFLPTLVKPADDVPNLSGPPTKLHIAIEDLRAAMRQAHSNRDYCKKLGQFGSDRVRREFDWATATETMIDRLLALAPSQPSGDRAIHVQTKSEEPPFHDESVRLAVIITDLSNPRNLIDTLARMRPFAESLFLVCDGEDNRTASIGQEYSATVLHASTMLQLDGFDWALFLRGGEYLAETSIHSLKSSLRNLSETISFVGLDTTAQYPADNQEIVPEIRLARLSETSSGQKCLERAFARFSADMHGVVQIPQRVAHVKIAGSDPTKFHPDSVSASNGLKSEKPVSTARTSSVRRWRASKKTHGRLGKSVLIQMATGPHLDLLDLSCEHHRRYAESHGMDYWCIAGNPTREKRAGWGKVPLLLAGIELGYEKVIWLDSDAVIVRPDFNLAALVNQGIGMVRHPRPLHWNTGFIVASASSDVAQFWRKVDSAAENDSAWMEQMVVNELCSQPQFDGITQPLDICFNSVPGYAMASVPVIIAAHGLPMHERATILKDALATAISSFDRSPYVAELNRREDFGHLLNKMNLVGEAVEIGVLRGEFSRTLLDNWRGRLLHLVDPWQHLPNYRDIANLSNEEFENCFAATQRNLAHHAGRYRIHRMQSIEAVQSFDDSSLDFVYLDADHSFEAVYQDLQNWYPKIKPGGILAGHDFLDGELPEGTFGVARAVRRFLQDINAELHVTKEKAWPSWYFVKSLTFGK